MKYLERISVARTKSVRTRSDAKWNCTPIQIIMHYNAITDQNTLFFLLPHLHSNLWLQTCMNPTTRPQVVFDKWPPTRFRKQVAVILGKKYRNKTPLNISAAKRKSTQCGSEKALCLNYARMKSKWKWIRSAWRSIQKYKTLNPIRTRWWLGKGRVGKAYQLPHCFFTCHSL